MSQTLSEPGMYDPSSIDILTESIRSQKIHWEAYQRGRIISQEQFELIQAYDKKDPYIMDSLLEKHGKVYAKLFLDLLKTLAKENAAQYILTAIDDMLTANGERVKLFHSREQDGYPFGPLLKCLEKPDEYTMFKANKILTGIICSGAPISNDDFKTYFDWLFNKLKSPTEAHLENSIQALMNLLLIADIRLKFADTPEGIQRLTDILRKRPNFQVTYQVVFCLWLLSYSKSIAEKLQNKYSVASLLVDIAKGSVKEKVIRVCIATFKNLLEKAPQANLQSLSDLKVLNLCQTLSARKWVDGDIKEDLEFLMETLASSALEEGSFEAYAAEVRSGKLEWTAPHKSEVFWKQNAQQLNEKDHELLKILVRHLSTSSDPTILSIACHDIGEYVRVYPRGKKALQQLGAKDRILALTMDSNESVRLHSLLAIQKFLVSNWEYLGTAALAGKGDEP